MLFYTYFFLCVIVYDDDYCFLIDNIAHCKSLLLVSLFLHENGSQQVSEEKFNIYKDQLDISLMGLKADIAKVEVKVEEISEHETKEFRELHAKFERAEEQQVKSLMETIAELLDDLPKGALEGVTVLRNMKAGNLCFEE